jgi:hypothetical protein
MVLVLPYAPSAVRHKGGIHSPTLRTYPAVLWISDVREEGNRPQRRVRRSRRNSIRVVGAMLRMPEATTVRITTTPRTTTSPVVISHTTSYCLTVSYFTKKAMPTL